MNKAENVLDIPNMTIDEKLTRIQNDLLKAPLRKSGENKFGGFTYFELEDLLPHILPLCLKYECRMSFVFTEDAAIIRLKNWKNKEEITSRCPVAPLEKLPKMNMAQVAGAYQTYYKRYLLYDLFCICEHDLLDTLDNTLKNKNDNVSSANNTKESKLDCNRLLKDAISKLKHKGLKGKEINFKSLTNTMYRMGKFSDDEKKEIADFVRAYCKKKFKSGGNH